MTAEQVTEEELRENFKRLLAEWMLSPVSMSKFDLALGLVPSNSPRTKAWEDYCAARDILEATASKFACQKAAAEVIKGEV